MGCLCRPITMSDFPECCKMLMFQSVFRFKLNNLIMYQNSKNTLLSVWTVSEGEETQTSCVPSGSDQMRFLSLCRVETKNQSFHFGRRWRRWRRTWGAPSPCGSGRPETSRNNWTHSGISASSRCVSSALPPPPPLQVPVNEIRSRVKSSFTSAAVYSAIGDTLVPLTARDWHPSVPHD